MCTIRRFKRPPIEVVVCPFLLMAGMAYGQGAGPDVVLGPPPGWELVRLTANPSPFPSLWPRMNNNTQIVWATITSFDPWVENIFLYDNGKVTAITNETGVENIGAYISDDEVIVWKRNPVGPANPDIARYYNGVIEILTGGETIDTAPSIRPDGTIFWSRVFTENWAELIRYQNGVETQITDNGLFNVSVEGDVHGDFVWARVNSFVSPWVGTIMFSLNGETLELSDGTTQVQLPDMNVHHQVVWSDLNLWRWDKGETTLVMEQGRGPTTNDQGDILFHRDDGVPAEPILYRDGVFYQFGDPTWNMHTGQLNNRGEGVFNVGDTFVTPVDIYLLWEIRDPADFDNDDDVDLLDFESFQNCVTGVEPDAFVPETCTHVFDFDDDGDIDFRDFGQLQTLFSPACEP